MDGRASSSDAHSATRLRPVLTRPDRLANSPGEPRADLLGLLGAGRLDHHSDQWLGPGCTNQNPAPAAQRLILPRDRRLHRVMRHRRVERRAILRAYVLEALREPLHRPAGVEVSGPERLERQQGAGDPIARGAEAQIDDVTGLLTAQGPAAPSKLVKHVAVAH